MSDYADDAINRELSELGEDFIHIPDFMKIRQLEDMLKSERNRTTRLFDRIAELEEALGDLCGALKITYNDVSEVVEYDSSNIAGDHGEWWFVARESALAKYIKQAEQKRATQEKEQS